MEKAILFSKVLPVLFFFLFVSGVKLNAQSPALLWQHCYGGPNDEIAYAMASSTDGGYLVAGATFGNGGDVSGFHGVLDGWVFKTDFEGILQWQICLGTANYEFMSGILPMPDGGCIVAGSGIDFPGGNISCGGVFNFEDFWMLRLGPEGAIEWQQCYGGTSQDIPYAITEAGDGGFFLAGFTRSDDGDVNGYQGEKDVWVVKAANDGSLQWTRALGGSLDDEAFDITATSDGGCIVAAATDSFDGDITSFHGGRDAWVVKLSTSGAVEWQQTLGGSADDEAQAVLPTSDGGYLLACDTRSSDGDVSGHHGQSDWWVVKLDNQGNLLWEKAYGGSRHDFVGDMLALPGGSFVITGHSYSRDGDLTANHLSQDFWLAGFDEAGGMLWQQSIGGSKYDYGEAIQLNADNELVLAGSTQSNDFEVSGNHGGYDIWLGRFPLPLAAGGEGRKPLRVSLSPNPAKERIRLQYDLPSSSEVRISVCDVAGREVAILAEGQRIKGDNEELLVLPARLMPGWHYLRLRHREEAEAVPFILEK
ncbi:MAG: hypothetical protein J5I98_11745 [Phaeodactylibacter sp.]|nr:hypothetical protein [Phaeodactylibacter sp.]